MYWMVSKNQYIINRIDKHKNWIYIHNSDQYNFRPRLRSYDSHLYIETATNHNISLVTKGNGYINVNNENLLQVIGLVCEFNKIIN